MKLSIGEYVRDQAHTNGIESFWAMLKRGYVGTFHKMSPKHLNRYVVEFAGRQNIRDLDTVKQMAALTLQGFDRLEWSIAMDNRRVRLVGSITLEGVVPPEGYKTTGRILWDSSELRLRSSAPGDCIALDSLSRVYSQVAFQAASWRPSQRRLISLSKASSTRRSRAVEGAAAR